jgi:hypothetical protein
VKWMTCIENPPALARQSSVFIRIQFAGMSVLTSKSMSFRPFISAPQYFKPSDD